MGTKGSREREESEKRKGKGERGESFKWQDNATENENKENYRKIILAIQFFYDTSKFIF